MILKRVAHTADGVFGVLIHEGIPFAVTLEPEWKNNQRNISCIPEGEYKCVRRKYHRGGYMTYEVTDVPNRSAILIHKGNTEDNSEGCILVGEQFETLNNKAAILQSGKAFDEFMEKLEGIETFSLYITSI